MTLPDIPIIDSHIHLYAANHLARLNWTNSLPEHHILNQQRSVDDYCSDSQNCANLVGFVFLEADRKFSHDPEGWTDPLQEVEFLVRIAQGKPVQGEGHSEVDSRLVLGIVPWAPVPAGPAALVSYTKQVRRICNDTFTTSLVKGFRYLVQDKDPGTMLTADFIAALQWLGQHSYSFDLGVDTRSGGMWQLQEACDMLREVYKDGTDLKVVINHFCKPNLHLDVETSGRNIADFEQWADHIRSLANFPGTYMKLSGLFSELPTQLETDPTSVDELAKQIEPWFDIVLEAFTPTRIMFGSDWPVCAANGLGSYAWQHWHDLVAKLLHQRNLTPDEQRHIWSATAMKAYNIRL